jgi:hypothetical protein
MRLVDIGANLTHASFRDGLAALVLLLLVSLGWSHALAFEVLDTGVPGRNEVYWLDDARILFPGFKRDTAGGGALRPVLYVWNHKTRRAGVHGEMAEAGYICYAAGYVRYAVRRGDKLFIREGRLGSESEREWPWLPSSARIDRDELTCRDQALADYEKVYPGFIFVPLRDQDGYYGWRKIENIKEALDSPLYYYLPGARKQPVALSIKAGQRDRVSYSEFLKAYVIEYTPGVRNEQTTGRLWVLRTDAMVEEHIIPAGPWLRGSVGYTPARGGIVMSSRAVGLRSLDDVGAAGVYLVRGSQVERMVAGIPSRYVAVSPDGCRAAAIVHAGARANEATLRVIEICRRGPA